jgi:hypothetical protein
MKDARRALVVLAIEDTLLKVGQITYYEVLDKLYDNYDCYVSDCYDHPEYLSQVLKELYGDGRLPIIESIKQYLAEVNTQEDIEKFIIKISE